MNVRFLKSSQTLEFGDKKNVSLIWNSFLVIYMSNNLGLLTVETDCVTLFWLF